MKKDYLPYTAIQKVHSLLMTLALIWMTVSLPFVAAAQETHTDLQEVETYSFDSIADLDEDDDEDKGVCNPYGNNTEEKGPNNTTQSSEEYLHHSDGQHDAIDDYLAHHTLHAAGEYVAFHGELLCPPPNFLS